MRQVRDTAAPYCVVRHRHEASPDECIVQYYSLNNDKKKLVMNLWYTQLCKKRSLSFVAAANKSVSQSLTKLPWKAFDSSVRYRPGSPVHLEVYLSVTGSYFMLHPFVSTPKPMTLTNR